ncbi:MAG: carbohydrate porin [Pseudanabaena sp. M57BS1SP1A06MG]|nr:carbohydrate porin [Pseudanabaena sp. M53BS1SP1A06MG]MCA6584222.1 carbohydrate porin [Pseudanabaena sp. M34BS1SP1A06MG]MCA6591754.1 carbohydrate porin [Pseudanabaena sp. M38BS1SP1A06MG]MCA6600702.1 carbohydrate porin [Pseudanabaena sp. M57BS1SP1A06MG]
MAKVWSQQVQVSLVGAIAISAISINASASAQSQQLTSVATQDVIGLNVTSVSQLSDVRPTDWAFTALQSLIERYGCIAGYPDRTFRGKQATSRYEFAAGLNACLDKINEIISAGLADKVSKDDLATLRKLQEEFAAELVTLRGRVNVLDAKVVNLEAQQFSTTTKLDGQVIVAVSASGSGTDNLLIPIGNLSGNSGKANTTVINRVRLNLNTSFTGEDLLLTRLEVGNGGASVSNSLDAANSVFRGFTGFKNSSVADYSEVGNNFIQGRLRYDFPIGKDIRASVGPIIALNDHLDKNSFANDESVDFSTRLFINNPLILPVNDGAGAAIAWNINGGAFSLRVGYVAANASSPTVNAGAPNGTINQGLFGDSYQGTFEFEFAPKNGEDEKPFALRLQYTRASVNNLDYNTGGLNLEWAFNKAIAIFGRYGFGNISNRGTAITTALPTYINAGTTGDSLSPQTWSVGFAFPDLFKEGAMAAIAVGQPLIESKVGNATQTNVELFYRFPISSNISITPDLQFIFNPNNNSGNSTITVGTLRTVFTF